MNTKRFLMIFLLLTIALTLGLSAARAQDEPPAKARPPNEGVSRETALGPNQALPPVWESEPNNDRTSADWISEHGLFATQLSGVIDAPGDVDYYEFYGIPGDVVKVTTAANRYGSAVDTIITLFNPAGTVLATNDDCYDDLDSCLSYTLTSEGEYNLKVEDYWGDRGGPGFWYDLFVWMPVRNEPEWWYEYQPGDEEPNNTRAQAYGVSYGRTLPWTQMDYSGDVDYFKFDGAAGDQVRIRVETTGLFEWLGSQASLYNGAGTLLASCGPANWLPNSSNCFLQKTLPKTGTYYVKVSDAWNYSPGQYWLQIGIVEPTEPNDSFAQAVPMAYGQTMRGLVTEGDWHDYYRFYGYQGDYVTMLDVGVGLEVFNQNGNYLASNLESWGLPLSYSLPVTGWYYVEVYAHCFLNPSPMYIGGYNLTIDRMMLAGVKTNGVAGGLTYNKSDILAWLPGSNGWAVFFDGSDAGVTTNLQDFDVVQLRHEGADWPYYLLMTLGTNARLQGRPDYFTAAPQDVVTFLPWGLGQSTSGRWEMYLDGSDIGLTTAAEVIDAVDMQQSEYDYLFLSTTGRATVAPNGGAPFTAEDEDLFRCDAPPGGWNTVTHCRLYFDGSAAGLPAAADIASVWIHPNTGDIYMTFATTTTVNGVAYKPNDVAVCQPNNFTMPLTSCTWLPKFWTGNAHGLGGKYIDGLTVQLERPD